MYAWGGEVDEVKNVKKIMNMGYFDHRHNQERDSLHATCKLDNSKGNSTVTLEQ